jgi:subtilase family serine protease
MTSRTQQAFRYRFFFALSAVTFLTTLLAPLCASSQTIGTASGPKPRIVAAIDNSSRVALQGSKPPIANSAIDAGPVAAGTQLEGISLIFGLSTAQQTALDTLVAAQQNPSSPLYHQWLTPATYAARFGMAASDIASAEAWLRQQGFTVTSVNNSRNRITFSGTAGQVASAFGASLHTYTTSATAGHPATSHYAPSVDLTIPAALAPVVSAVGNLSDFRPHPHVKLQAPRATPKFTSAQTGENFLTPGDVATLYDIAPATGAGYTGTGQTIVIVGQSAIETSDLSNFQTAAGLPAKLPTQILVPGTGTSTINPGGSSDEDEVESDIDLEYSNAIAQGATIDFIYTGSNTNDGAFDALQYAVDNKSTYPASIISSSYGTCEPLLGSSSYAQLNAILEQAASQGQTVIAAAGDSGSTDCDGEYSSSDAAANEQRAVDYPASSQYVTGMGGTEFPVADIAPDSSYFAAAGTSDLISSAKSYIPEQVWNDDAGDVSLGSTSPSPISSGGGGVSIYTPLPSWQTGVPGIPISSYRMVPDIALYASPGEPDVSADNFYGGLLYCSSDSSATEITGSCSHGFRDTNDEYVTVAGGTSFDAPIFSGMLAILNQAKGYTAASGEGIINPTLYTLASNAATYASAFHDITSGGNECAAGTAYCGTGNQTADYLAGTGYDEASGLGSVDLYNLLMAWPASGTTVTSTLASSTTTLTAATATPVGGANDVITIKVASNSSTVTATPTGTVSIMVNGTTVGSALTLSNGSAPYTFSSATAGSDVIQANYSGDSNYQASAGTVTVTVGTVPVPSFTLAGTNVTIAAGASSTSNVTITPAGGYAGTVDFTVAVNASSAVLTNACYSISNTAVSGTSPVTATLSIATSSASCSGATAGFTAGKTHGFVRLAGQTPASPFTPAPAGLALAGLALAYVGGRRSKKLRLLVYLAMLTAIAGALSGCGSSSTASATNAAPGTYTLTITGTDSVTSTITASTTITLTIT